MHPLIEQAMDSDKPIFLTQSEIDNAEVPYGEGESYTIIRRLQPTGQYLIAAVGLTTRKILSAEIAENREDCPRAVKECNRWMDKAFGGGKMSHKSRGRKVEKPS